jgi:hypothetical protein
MSNLLICSGLFLEFIQAASYCFPNFIFCFTSCDTNNFQVKFEESRTHLYSTDL